MDWFVLHSKELDEYGAKCGQRTWTVLVCLSAIE